MDIKQKRTAQQRAANNGMEVSVVATLRSTVEEAIQAAANNELPSSISKSHSFLDDLGFDSLTLSVLTLELEDRMGRPIVLNRWVERASSPSELTVGSLLDYLDEVLD